MAAATFVLALFVSAVAGAAKPTFAYNDQLPNKSEPGQYGTNKCGHGDNKNSLCQNVIINSIDDFCLYAPPSSKARRATIGDTERYEVSWCTKSGYGTRVFPNGTIKGAHFVKTPDYVQITGWGDFTKIGVSKGDAGGELDPHGADGKGNPIGGLVFGNSYGKMQQYPEWTNFMSATEFCIRACNPAGPNATKYCAHRYDIMGCEWNMPGNYGRTTFDTCQADSGEPMGIYTNAKVTITPSASVSGASPSPYVKTTTITWHQGQKPTPAAHPKPKVSNCVKAKSITSGGHAKRTADAPGPARTAF